MAAHTNDKKLFFSQTSVPDRFEEACLEVDKFLEFHSKNDRKLVLISSGGTTVPLESRTVRFIDNFSSGTRGSSSAEYFLENGYAVIFLHRHKSLEPFARHLSRYHILDRLELTHDDNIIVNKDTNERDMVQVLKQYKQIKSQNMLLMLEFTSLGDYLHLLKATCHKLNPYGPNVMLYLAAAVSDFYIPKADMREHKIQSSNGPLELKLQLVPKMLEPLVKDWVSSAFVTSFKLETDPQLLISKAQQALQKYQHQLVIANELEKRKTEVTLVTNSNVTPLQLTEEEVKVGCEIESRIVKEIAKLHDDFIKSR